MSFRSRRSLAESRRVFVRKGTRVPSRIWPSPIMSAVSQRTQSFGARANSALTKNSLEAVVGQGVHRRAGLVHRGLELLLATELLLVGLEERALVCWAS